MASQKYAYQFREKNINQTILKGIYRLFFNNDDTIKKVIYLTILKFNIY